MSKSKTVLEVFDFRRGKSFDLRTDPQAPELLSGSMGLVVIEAVRVNWNRVAGMLEEFASPSDTKFAIFRPWAPGIAKAVATFKAEWPSDDVVNADLIQLAFIDGRSASLDALLSLTERVGKNAGVWLFGSSPVPRAALEARIRTCNLDDHMIYVATCLADASTVSLALDEGVESYLFLRADRAPESVVDALAQTISQGDR